MAGFGSQRVVPQPASLAFFGVQLKQVFGEHHDSEDLRPLGNDVADHLSPSGVGVGRGEQPNPTGARDHQKDAQRVIFQGAPMRARVGVSVKSDPGAEYDSRHETERMAMKKSFPVLYSYGCSMTEAGAKLL